MNAKKITTLILVLTSAAGISGKPLDLSQVSDDANWLMHVDFDAARKSTIGSFILEELDAKPDAMERLTSMTEKIGLDPMAFANLTMFGSGERKKGIAIMKGGIDEETIEAFAKKNETLETTLVGKNKVHSVNQDRRHPMAFSIIKKDTAIAGPDSSYVSQGIRLAKGKGASRAPIGLLDELRATLKKPGFISYVDIRKASKFHDLERRGGAMVRKVSSAGMAMGETAGELKVVAIVKTDNEETAIQLENMARGMMAMVALGKESKPFLAEILESQKVVRKGNDVRMEVGLAIETIKELIEREMEKNI